MPKYIVGVREVHVSHMEIEANTPEHAKDLVRQGVGEEQFLEYSHTLDSDLWTVEDSMRGFIIVMRGFIILKDYINSDDPRLDRSGKIVSWGGIDQLVEVRREDVKKFPVRFRAYDDDGELYYAGRSTDEDGIGVGDGDLWKAYKWMQADAGVTYLEVSFDGGKTWEHFP